MLALRLVVVVVAKSLETLCDRSSRRSSAKVLRTREAPRRIQKNPQKNSEEEAQKEELRYHRREVTPDLPKNLNQNTCRDPMLVKKDLILQGFDDR